MGAPSAAAQHYTRSFTVHRERRRETTLWLTQFIGFGSTGHVWKCRFDNSDGLYAIKVVESPRGSEDEVERQQRFYNEVEVYSTLETAYQSGQLRDRITPHFYGAFKGDGIYVLILELSDVTLNTITWEPDELSILER
jgi:serine/threonine protein kinase